MLAYLSGSIEYSPDQGRAWRASITPFLQSLGCEVYDPASDEKKNLDDFERKYFRSWKTTDLARFQATLRKIIRYDLDLIEYKADFLIVYWDEYAGRGAGTQAEVSMAYRRGIPIYLVAAMPIAEISGWILGCSTEIFHSFEDLKLRLSRLSAAGNPVQVAVNLA